MGARKFRRYSLSFCKVRYLDGIDVHDCARSINCDVHRVPFADRFNRARQSFCKCVEHACARIVVWPDDYSCTGVLYTFTKALARPIKPIGEWNTMDITIDGPRTIVYVNAIKVTDFTEGQAVPAKLPGSHDPDRGPRPDSGFIGLQNHPGSEVYFREVSVVPLSR